METSGLGSIKSLIGQLPLLQKQLQALERDISAIFQNAVGDPAVKADIAPLEGRASSLREEIKTLEELGLVERGIARTEGKIESLKDLDTAARAGDPKAAIKETVDSASPEQLKKWQEMGLIRSSKNDYPYPEAIKSTMAGERSNLEGLQFRKEAIQERLTKKKAAPLLSTAVKAEQFKRSSGPSTLRRTHSAPELGMHRSEKKTTEVQNRTLTPQRARPKSLPRSLDIKPLQPPSKEFVAEFQKEKAKVNEELKMVSGGIARSAATVKLLQEFETAFQGKDIRGLQAEIERIVDGADSEKSAALNALGLGKQRAQDGAIGYPNAVAISNMYQQATRDLEGLEKRKSQLEAKNEAIDTTLAQFPAEKASGRSATGRVRECASKLFSKAPPKVQLSLLNLKATFKGSGAQAA